MVCCPRVWVSDRFDSFLYTWWNKKSYNSRCGRHTFRESYEFHFERRS
ncbi:hypothetical protein [Rubritalea tangerina]